ncbi:hypothetical protein ACET3Z_020841 [Daucus carota]
MADLPKKFWFADEPKEKEVDEHEEEVKRLFAEMDVCLKELEEEKEAEAEEEEEGHTREELVAIFENYIKELQELDEEEDEEEKKKM